MSQRRRLRKDSGSWRSLRPRRSEPCLSGGHVEPRNRPEFIEGIDGCLGLEVVLLGLWLRGLPVQSRLVALISLRNPDRLRVVGFPQFRSSRRSGRSHSYRCTAERLPYMPAPLPSVWMSKPLSGHPTRKLPLVSSFAHRTSSFRTWSFVSTAGKQRRSSDRHEQSDESLAPRSAKPRSPVFECEKTLPHGLTPLWFTPHEFDPLIP